jgi:predicted acyltransferase
MAMPQPRFLSLDVFRGLTVCLMIIVNTPGAGGDPYPWLEHAGWFGFTVTDLVFPSFLFAVGAAMAFAFSRPIDNRTFLLKVAKRTALIFLLGVLMYWYPFVQKVDGAWSLIPVGGLRIMGVLQRIALCYALASLAVRYLPPRGLLVLSAILLLGYWAVLLAFGDPAAPLSKLGNIGARIDLLVIGQAHLYRWDGGFDPEGLLGTLPAVVNVLAGYLAARFLRQQSDPRASLFRLVLAAGVLVIVALGWSLVFPIGKKLWTSSFVLLTVGLDLMVLAALIALLEGRKSNAAVAFFQVFGLNPLALYLFSELFVVTLQRIEIRPGVDLYTWIGEAVFQAIAPGAFGSLLFAIAYMLVCWLLGYGMKRRGVVIKL